MEIQARDIRRALPRYIEREGDVVYGAPFRDTAADLNVFVLAGSVERMQEVLDEQLNDIVREGEPLIGSAAGLRFVVEAPYLVLIYGRMRSLSSVAERGFVAEFELSVWMPITKYQVIGRSSIARPAWFLPLVYTAPAAAVATGREVFGFPKVPAFLVFPEDWKPPEAPGPPVAVRTTEIVKPHRNASMKEFFHASFDAGSFANSSRPPASELHSLVVRRFLANLPIVFRKQVGRIHIDGQLRASYTGLVESRIPITSLRGFEPKVSTLDITASTPASPSVANTLGVTVGIPQIGFELRNCTFDVQQGRELWVAKDRRRFVESLAVPGNALILDPEPLNNLEGATQVFLAPGRKEAIATLLARDFPGSFKPEWVVDSEFPWIALMLFRARAGAQVRLYEFGVWIPVRYQSTDGTKRRAWYVPYLFRSPSASVVHAREWHGHPCQEAFIEFSRRSPERSVALTQPVWGGSSGPEWIKKPGVVFKRSEDREAPDVQNRVGSALDTLQRIHEVVALQQVRHVDAQLACIQQVIRYERKVALQGQPTTRKYTLVAPAYLKLSRLLDLDGPQSVVIGHEFNSATIRSTRPTILT